MTIKPPVFWVFVNLYDQPGVRKISIYSNKKPANAARMKNSQVLSKCFAGWSQFLLLALPCGTECYKNSNERSDGQNAATGFFSLVCDDCGVAAVTACNADGCGIEECLSGWHRHVGIGLRMPVFVQPFWPFRRLKQTVVVYRLARNCPARQSDCHRFPLSTVLGGWPLAPFFLV
jgi:hypothetical protein